MILSSKILINTKQTCKISNFQLTILIVFQCFNLTFQIFDINFTFMKETVCFYLQSICSV